MASGSIDKLAAHREAVSKAHGTFQAAHAAASTEAGRKAAHVQLYRDILASGHTNGVSTGAKAALARLGYPEEQALDGNI